MNLLMVSDNNYAFLLGVSLYSLFNTNRDIEEIEAYVIADNISYDNKKKLKEIADLFNRKIIFLKPPVLDEKIVVKGTLNVSTYYRLKMASILPAGINKILYLDCDTLVRGNLNELWNTNVEDFLLAGVTDTTGKNSRLSIELDREDIYVNAGVLLINLKRWREEEVENKFLDYLKQKKYIVEFNDQGVINHICSKKTILINPKYNFMMPYERFSRKNLLRIVQRVEFYNNEEIRAAKNNPLIVHFAGYAFNRPWFKNAKGKYVNEFRMVLNNSGFEIDLKELPQNYKFLLRKFANSMPNKLNIIINRMIDDIYRKFVSMKK